MSNATQTARINAASLNQEVTQQAVLDALQNLDTSVLENGWFEGAQTIASTGNDITVFTSSTVGGGLSRWINEIKVTCNKAGKFTILKGASIIGSGRISPSERNVPYSYSPGFKLNAGESVIVKYEQFNGTDSDIEVYAQGIEK